MKKLYCVLFFLSVLALSCSKDSLMNSDLGTDQMLNNAALNASGLVIKVYPNNIDDTQNLIDAFNQATASGTVVKLMPGTFKINMIEVGEFSGTLTGSGIGKTIITNLPDLSFPDGVTDPNYVPTLIAFIGGNVTVSNLSVRLSDLNWNENLPIYKEMMLLLFSDYSVDISPSIQQIKVNVNNIELVGYPTTTDIIFDGLVFGPTNVRPHIGYLEYQGPPNPRSNIAAIVANSKFSNFNAVFYVWGCKSGSFILNNNLFSNGGSGVHENIGINVKIMKNQFSYAGLDLNTYESYIFEYTPLKVGTYEIRDNTFNRGGFGLWDNWRYDHPDNPDWMRMVWDHNTFNIPTMNEIWGSQLFGLKDAIFSNNTFTGNALGGIIYVRGNWCGDNEDGCQPWTEGCQFLNNIFMQKNFVIYFGKHTIDNLIKGNLKNVTINNNGINNQIISKTN